MKGKILSNLEKFLVSKSERLDLTAISESERFERDIIERSASYRDDILHYFMHRGLLPKKSIFLEKQLFQKE